MSHMYALCSVCKGTKIESRARIETRQHEDQSLKLAEVDLIKRDLESVKGRTWRKKLNILLYYQYALNSLALLGN